MTINEIKQLENGTELCISYQSFVDSVATKQQEGILWNDGVLDTWETMRNYAWNKSEDTETCISKLRQHY